MNEMEEFKQVFFTECAELLTEMEERLLKLDEGVTNADQLNAIFRCAHSIKGGSGAFGLDAIMRFTHRLEALLDSMRSGDVLPTRAAIDALLQSVDIVHQMLAAAQENRAPQPGLGDEVLAALEACAPGGQTLAAAPVAAAPAAETAAPAPTEEAQAAYRYTIGLRAHKHLLVTGNEPLLILRELCNLGSLTVAADTAAVPTLDQLDPVACYLQWQLVLESSATEETVWEVFEFVRDLADITLTHEPINSRFTLSVPAAAPAYPPRPTPPPLGRNLLATTGKRQRKSLPPHRSRPQAAHRPWPARFV